MACAPEVLSHGVVEVSRFPAPNRAQEARTSESDRRHGDKQDAGCTDGLLGHGYPPLCFVPGEPTVSPEPGQALAPTRRQPREGCSHSTGGGKRARTGRIGFIVAGRTGACSSWTSGTCSWVERCARSSRAWRPPLSRRRRRRATARFLNMSAVQTQGRPTGDLPPNAYGQRAFGKCLSLIYGKPGTGCAATGRPGGRTEWCYGRCARPRPEAAP